MPAPRSLRRVRLVVAKWPVIVLAAGGCCALLGVGTLSAQNGPLVPGNVSVSPDGTYEPDHPKNTGGYVTTFTAYNNTGSTITFSYGCWGTGGISCANITPPSGRLASGRSQVLTVTYNIGASGGELHADMEGGGYYDQGYRIVTTPPTLTVVTPALTQSPDTGLVHTRTPLVLATYTTTDAAIDTTSLVIRVGNDTVTKLARWNSRVAEWEVDSARQLSPGVPKSLLVKICHINAGCTSITRQLLLDNSGPPIVSFAGMPLELHPAVAETQTGLATPPYVSMGVSRSAGLVYSTRQAFPRVLVNVDLELTWPAGNPDQIKAVLIDGVVRLDSLVVSSPTCQSSTGRRCRVSLQANFAGTTFATATRKWVKVEVRVTSGATTKTTTDSVEAVLVDRRASAYGAGWFVSGVARLDAAGSDMLLVGSDGSAQLFRGSSGVYLAPPGQTDVLVWTGSQGELRSAVSPCSLAKVVFDAQGRQTQVVDCHNNLTQFKYGAADRVDTIIDPVGKKLSFTFSGGKLTTITDPGGRQTKVTIDGSNRLTYDSLASPPGNPAKGTFSYTSYGANNTWVLTSAGDALGQTTTYGYDTRGRPAQTTLPAVLPETGTTPVSPVITYRAQALRGLDSLLSQDSVFGRVTDARGAWTRSLLNRWGAPLRTWDALGTLSRAAYTADGLVLWSEGKVADSSRVYFTYNALGQLVRSFRRRTASDTVRLDSLVYDAAHRVVARIDALNQATTYAYSSYGDVVRTVTPTHDTTSYQYTVQGLVDSVRAPGQTGKTGYSYNATWKNRWQVTNAAGVVLSTTLYDAFGRATETQRKLTVRLMNMPDEPDSIQWRRTRTWYDALNRVDSTRLERTNTCVAPCTSPPGWPADADTTRWEQVRHLYDRLGRDTARVNTRGKRSRYAYDALGRLRMRWPFADSAAVVDSFRYDLGGNLRFQWTRRGYLLEHRYDSRSRDTLMIVPTIGSYHSAYGGPLDQLTRLWMTSYGDSIGGVNPAVSWAYSQAGLLLADTAQGTRIASHRYDRLGRDTLVTDPAGVWRMRYDAVRGLPDSLVTPYGDTLVWSYDARWRAVGPSVRNGSAPDYSVGPEWDQVGKLVRLSSTHTVQVGLWEVDSTLPDLELRPRWTERQGSGGPTVTELDTLVHDGWGRVTGASYLKNGVALASESFQFGRNGDLRVGSESRFYDATTSRMTWRAGGSYSYDRSGNLVSWVSGGTTWTYGYDALERLIWVKQNGALVARYAYDVLGRRIVKRVYTGANAGYLRMLYRGDQVRAETDSGGTLALGYTWGFGTDNLVAMHRMSDGGHWYVVQDALSSVRGLSKKDGTWVASWRYAIYGAVLDSAGTAPVAVRYRWTGREYDQETGFYYFRARYYDPVAQRFVQEDPIGYAGGTNLYAYGAGNPTNGRDPGGLLKVERHWEDPGAGGALEICWECGGGGVGGWDWDGDGQEDFLSAWEQLTLSEQEAYYDAYSQNYNRLQSSGELNPYLSALGSFLNKHTEALSVEQFGDIYSAIKTVIQRATERDNPWMDFAARLLPWLLENGRMGYNRLFLATFDSKPKDRVLIVGTRFRSDVFGSDIGPALFHEATHFRLYYLGGAARRHWREECVVGPIASSASGWSNAAYETDCP